eukprot:s972_g9.t1
MDKTWYSTDLSANIRRVGLVPSVSTSTFRCLARLLNNETWEVLQEHSRAFPDKFSFTVIRIRFTKVLLFGQVRLCTGPVTGEVETLQRHHSASMDLPERPGVRRDVSPFDEIIHHNCAEVEDVQGRRKPALSYVSQGLLLVAVVLFGCGNNIAKQVASVSLSKRYAYMLGLSTAVAYVPLFWAILLVLLQTGAAPMYQLRYMWQRNGHLAPVLLIVLAALGDALGDVIGAICTSHVSGPVHSLLSNCTSGHTYNSAVLKCFLKSTMANAEPWKCAYCKRIAKAKEDRCPKCKWHWTKVYDPDFVQGVPQTAKQDSWVWGSHTAPNQGAAARRSSSSRRRRSQKGKGKEAGKHTFPSLPSFQGGKGPSATAASPFAGTTYSTSSTTAAPWPSMEPPGKDAELEQARQDLVVAVQKHFPDPTTMPTDVKTSLEKYGAIMNKQVTKDMHKTTTHMDKSRTAIAELQKAKDSHRKAWILHITEAAEAWKEQMLSYQAQQKEYSVKLAQAQAELEAAHRAMQDLNTRAGPLSRTFQPKVEPMADPDKEEKEEKEAKVKVQEILAQCATMIHIEDDEVMNLISEDEGPERKRARSIEKETPAAGGHTGPDGSHFGSM